MGEFLVIEKGDSTILTLWQLTPSAVVEEIINSLFVVPAEYSVAMEAGEG